ARTRGRARRSLGAAARTATPLRSGEARVSVDPWCPAGTSCAEAPASGLQHLPARLLGPRGSDRGFHFLLFLGGWQHRRHAERLDPQLAAPAGRVVEVLVLLVFYLIVGGHERLPQLAS